MLNVNQFPFFRIFGNTESALIVLFGGLITSPVWKYIKENGWEHDAIFLACLGGLLFVDFVTGVTKGVKMKNLSSSKMKDTPIKMLLYMALFVGVFMFSYFLSLLEQHTSFWVKSAVYSAILITELLSITENVAALSQLLLGRNIVPPVLLKFLRDFDENGVFRGIKDIQNETRDINRGQMN